MCSKRKYLSLIASATNASYSGALGALSDTQFKQNTARL